jgi:hypothetical protein
MGGHTRVVYGQRLGKHVPAATHERNNGTVFHVVRVEMI